MKPNAKANYNPDPVYLRSLIEKSGLSQLKIAEMIDINPRTLRRYLADSDNYKPAPYLVQYALEVLAFFSSQQ